MSSYIAYVLIAAIGYFSYACGRSYGWTGAFVFLGALLVLAIAIVVNLDEQAELGPTLILISVAFVLATIVGAAGVAKRRAAQQSAGSKPPKSG
ncbi:MAG: hypothetical protein ABJ263_14890 [Tateyamaria sp.]|uniref:hypothetical protein n=1 Tax=Tateyamaria sp. TaxID=1929288 RepID=UPI00329164D7